MPLKSLDDEAKDFQSYNCPVDLEESVALLEDAVSTKEARILDKRKICETRCRILERQNQLVFALTPSSTLLNYRADLATRAQVALQTVKKEDKALETQLRLVIPLTEDLLSVYYSPKQTNHCINRQTTAAQKRETLLEKVTVMTLCLKVPISVSACIPSLGAQYPDVCLV
ncbi:hypothetical protein BDP27DRAFT_1374122 [Rhodocollybia butyracea]|uniref:Uncharacterized protein n=1 Tax=Rhodocollybia butyracea TaxID=206335 RepID=A0A9P5P8D0_9AGAR|nr:hypothetical protein BDP27DRAFT_1374122 [Rhodocollybia butyracea]